MSPESVHTTVLTSTEATSNAELAALVLRQFRVVFAEVRHHFQQVEKIAGIGGAQVWVLSLIQRSPGIGIRELTKTMDVHQSTASNLVKHLVTRGLLRSQRSSVDRRAVHLFVTAEGEQLLSLAPTPHEGVLPRALRKLSHRDLQQLQESLNALQGVLKVSDDAATTPLANL